MGNIKLVSGKGRKATTVKEPVAGKAREVTVQQPRKTTGATNNIKTNNSAAVPNIKKVRKTKSRIGIKVALAVLIVLIAGAAVAFVVLGFYVDNLDTVYPNVWADGINLAGLSLDDANHALIETGYESNAKDVSATIRFPDSVSFTITGDEAGFAMDASQAAAVAYEYGREGTFFQKEIAFIKAYLKRTDLRVVSSVSLDEEYVRSVAAEHTKTFNSTLIDGAYDISSDRIIVVKGAGVMPAVENEVFELAVATLNKALEEKAQLTAEYTPSSAHNEDVDLDMLLNTIKKDPMDAHFDPETFDVIEGSSGRTFDMTAARVSLDNAGTGERIVIPLLMLQPSVFAAELEAMLYRDVLAEKTTNIAGTSNRVNNVGLASDTIDGTILLPGEVFSFNDTVGMRTAEKGYREAGAYVSGNTVLEIGGGICQTSSTIYDVVLKSNLEVIERRPHMFTVAYLPLGNDATVNWGTIDFKFKNNTDYPIRIDSKADVAGRKLNVQIIGTKLDDNYINIEYKLISTNAYQTIREEDESVPEGQTIVKTDGHTGYVVDTYKYLYDKDDNLIEEIYVGRSTYRSQDRLILIPPENLSEEEPDDGETGEQDPDETEPGETQPPEETGEQDPDETEPGEPQPPDETEPTETEPGEDEPSQTESPDAETSFDPSSETTDDGEALV